MSKINFVLLIILFTQCHQVDSVSSSFSYSEINLLFELQLENKPTLVRKTIVLDGIEEIKSIEPDSVAWLKEVGFLEEINPNKPEYKGAFEEESLENQLSLKLKEGENGSIKSFSIKTTGNQSVVNVTIQEDKTIFVHQKKVSAKFLDGKLTEYSIEGTQKIILKDAIDFSISAKIDW